MYSCYRGGPGWARWRAMAAGACGIWRGRCFASILGWEPERVRQAVEEAQRLKAQLAAVDADANMAAVLAAVAQ